MVKHAQTIRPQFADELFECLWPFCDTAFVTLKGLTLSTLAKYSIILIGTLNAIQDFWSIWRQSEAFSGLLIDGGAQKAPT